MIRQFRRFSVVLLALVLFLPACSQQRENLAALEPDDLYARAEAAYEARDWEQATRILEYFVTQYVGHPRAPDARMLLGDLYMTRRDYAVAATHFQRMVLDFPSHARALEARFKICEAYYRLSPRPALDQEYTVSALDHCESVRDNFAGTPEAEAAAAHVVELRDKLAEKGYQNGMFYFRRNAFDAAVVYFEDVLALFPDTAVAPAALAQLIKTYERIGYVEEAEAARERLLQEYPESDEARTLAAEQVG